MDVFGAANSSDPFRSSGYRRRLIFNTYRRAWVFVLVMAGAIATRRLSGAPFGVIDWIPICLLALPIVAGVLAPTPRRMLVGMAMAAAKGKWKDVESLADMLERSLEKDATAEVRFEVRQFKACALVRIKGVNEALSALRPLESSVDEATYAVGVGRVNAIANQHEPALRCFERSTELDPAHAAAWIMRAETLLAMDRFEEAGAVIEHVESLPMTDDLNVMRIAVLGAVLIEEGRAAETLEMLEHGLITADELAARQAGVSLVKPMIQGVLAWALAEVGETERAAAIFEEARAPLEATGTDWLLTRAGGVHGTV